MSWFSEIRKEISQAWREGWAEYERKHPRRVGLEARISPKPSPVSGWSSDAARSRQELLENWCKSCGSHDLDGNYSNSHARCRACGIAVRKDLAAWETLPSSPQLGPTFVRAGFGASGGVEIREYDLDGRLVGSRPATKRDQQAAPKPVPFVGIRA